MSINTVKGPLIQSNINNDNNTTRIMEVDTLYSAIISDGIASIENGYISNLINPTANNEIATKYYVDHSGGGGGAAGPNNSIQYNNGTTFAGSANLTLTNPTSSLATLNINGTLTNGTMVLAGSQISGLTNPTTGQQAATKNYVDESLNKLGTASIDLQQNVSTIYTPAQVYNNIVNIYFDPNNIDALCPIDSFPSAASMKSFLGAEFTLGKSWTTIVTAPRSGNEVFIRFFGQGTGSIFNPITDLYCGNELPVTTSMNYSTITIISVVTNATLGSEQYYSYVSSYFVDLPTNAQITDQGILTPSIGNGSLVSSGTIVYPIPSNPILNNASSITYTYTNLKQFLIIRTGLTTNTSDTFVSASTFVSDSDFTMGGGTFRFFIQNPTAFSLTLTPATGWSFQSGSSNVIPAGYCGAFWVTVVVSPASCLIRSMGINSING